MTTMNAFATRILEVHSHYAWDQDHMRRAIRFAAAQGMTGVALHRNDIVDELVYPGSYFGTSGDRRYRNTHERYQDIFRRLYRLTPTRRSRPNIRRDYLCWMVDEASRHGLELWLENKEVWYPDILVELVPDVLVDGHVCPTHPLWPRFLEEKYAELIVDLPGFAGLITSPATRESRLSISGNTCECDRCRATRPGEWYRRVLAAVHGPLQRAGKRLVVRDFVFDSAAHADIASGIEALPAEIIVSFKNTPHDYYPTFPHNPRIGQVGSRRQWVEFDTMGQYFGWGIAPAIMIDDHRDRMTHALRHGVEGVLIRTDWESLDSHSCFRTPNLVSLYSAAALSRDPATDSLSIYARWLEEQRLLPSGASASAKERCARWAQQVLGGTWPVTRRALYTNDCVFSDSSTLPVSLDHAWWLAEEKNSLRDWDASKQDALAPTDENIARILEEKADALSLWEQLNERARENPGLVPEAHAEMVERFRVFGVYVKTFALIGQTAILARRLVDASPAPARADIERYGAPLAERLAALRAHAEALRDFGHSLAGAEYVIPLLLNPERVTAFIEDVTRRLSDRQVRLPAA
jgi:hypothetical protein